MVAGSGAVSAGCLSCKDGPPDKCQHVYRKGSVRRVKIHNFVTYDDAEVSPGPSLNIVVGPNGSGKSSIIAALCLTLGGKPELLGKAPKTADYIKFNKNSAYVEVELDGGPGGSNTTVKRSFVGDTSQYWLNGRRASQVQVVNAMHELNVRVNNLTQFLPQERVSKFAEMSPSELLEATEEAIDETLLTQHRELIALRKSQVAAQRDYDGARARLTELQARQEEVQRDLERLQERQAKLDEAARLRRKVPWLQYEKEANRYSQLKEETKRRQDELSVLEERLAPLQNQIAQLEDDASVARDHAATASRDRKTAEHAVDSARNQINRINSEVGAARQSVAEAEHALAQHESALARLDEQIAATEERLSKLPAPTAEAKDKKNQLAREARDVELAKRQTAQTQARARENLTKIEHRRREALRREQNLSNAARQREEAACREDRQGHVRRMIQFLRQSEQENRLAGTWFHVASAIKVTDKYAAAWVQGAVGYRACQGFVFDCEQDASAALKYAKANRLNCSLIHQSDLKEWNPPNVDIKRFGFDSWLSDCITAPPLVVSQLVSSGVDRIPVAENPRALESAGQLFEQRLTTVFAGFKRSVMRSSAYDATFKTQSVSDIQPSRILSYGGMDDEAIARVRVEVAAETRECDAQTAQLSKEIDAAAAEVAELDKRKLEIRAEQRALEESEKEYHRIAQRLAAMQGQRRAISDRSQLEGDLQSYKAREQRAVAKILPLAKKLTHAVIAMHANEDVRAKAVLRRALAMEVLQQVQAQLATASQSLEAQRLRIDEAKQAQQDCRARARQLKQEAETMTGPMTAEMETEFAEYSDDVTELQAKVHQLEMSANAIMGADGNAAEVEAQFQARAAEIANLQGQVDAFSTRREAVTEDIIARRAQWQPRVEEIVAGISNVLMGSFQMINAMGECHLRGPSGGEGFTHDDFAEYGIELRVKFRDGADLETLDIHRHSGGERSISTILYLLALQNQTDCPFRVVDEINQGMDAKNERVVMCEMIRSSSQTDLPQYFVVTPKLLPNLNYAANMRIICVSNGSRQVPDREWSVQEQIAAARRIRDELEQR